MRRGCSIRAFHWDGRIDVRATGASEGLGNQIPGNVKKQRGEGGMKEGCRCGGVGELGNIWILSVIIGSCGHFVVRTFQNTFRGGGLVRHGTSEVEFRVMEYFTLKRSS